MMPARTTISQLHPEECMTIMSYSWCQVKFETIVYLDSIQIANCYLVSNVHQVVHTIESVDYSVWSKKI